VTPIDVSGTERAVGKTENTPWDFGILKLENIFAISRKPEKSGQLKWRGCRYKLLLPGDLELGSMPLSFTYKIWSFSPVSIFRNIHLN